MAQATALDAKLRDRGSRKLRDELDRLFTPVLDRVNSAPGSVMLEHTREGSTAQPPESARQAIERAREALEEALSPTYQQQEVDAFLERVDGMKAKIEELDADLRG